MAAARIVAALVEREGLRAHPGPGVMSRAGAQNDCAALRCAQVCRAKSAVKIARSATFSCDGVAAGLVCRHAPAAALVPGWTLARPTARAWCGVLRRRL